MLLSNSKIDEIFKESIQKLNSIIMYLDSQLGTVSLTKEEISLLGGLINNYKPLLKLEANFQIKKEEKKRVKMIKNEEKNESENKKEQKQLDYNNIFKLCDLRVGKVVSTKIMEGFNDIYELEIDLGEDNLRKIASGLRNYVPMEKISNSKVIVFSNLITKKFGNNFESNGIIMTASIKNKEKEIIELIRPNENSHPGDKVFLEGNELDKSKVKYISGGNFKKAIKLFKTDENCFCTFNEIKIVTESGNIKSETLKNANIS